PTVMESDVTPGTAGQLFVSTLDLPLAPVAEVPRPPLPWAPVTVPFAWLDWNADVPSVDGPPPS
ncbi:MAG: hypothetical protein ACRD1T_03805, partial [Acidimicrobiia bacterium]